MVHALDGGTTVIGITTLRHQCVSFRGFFNNDVSSSDRTIDIVDESGNIWKEWCSPNPGKITEDL
jgi:hypothetical protein